MQGLRTCIYKVTDLEAGKACIQKPSIKPRISTIHFMSDLISEVLNWDYCQKKKKNMFTEITCWYIGV